MTLDSFFKDIFSKKSNNLVKKEDKSENGAANAEETTSYTKRERNFLDEINRLKEENAFFREEVVRAHEDMKSLRTNAVAILDKYIPKLFKIVYEEGFFDGIKYRTHAENPSDSEAKEVIAMRLEAKEDFIRKLLTTMKKPFVPKTETEEKTKAE